MLELLVSQSKKEMIPSLACMKNKDLTVEKGLKNRRPAVHGPPAKPTRQSAR